MDILVCDDERPRYESTRARIKERADVNVAPLVGCDLACALTALFDGVAALLDNGGGLGALDNKRFEGFDVVVVDNNLTGLDLKGARMTAETIIGYLRAFTDIPYIISLNKNPHVDFDLRYLIGDYQSMADLALNTEHLSNACLWGRRDGSGFAPWYWPQLENAAGRRREQIEFLSDKLTVPVWVALEFPPEAEEYLSFRARAALSSGEGNIRGVPFKSFFRASRVLTPAELRSLEGLAERGEEWAHRAICRVAAYEVDRWLRRDVLGAQDVLIDVPHLVAQMPIVLGERQGELDAWNRAANESRAPFALGQGMFADHLREACFSASAWVPVPCFWWPKLRANRTLSKLFFDSDVQWPDAVFCEDVSGFVPVTGLGDGGPPLEFESEIDGSWSRRFVRDVDGYQYSPRSRIVGRASGA
ncbi:MAG: hypothetical protein F4Y26_06530 [Gammaproteobacteria bacterium]|nr:hypothetical protein [Gammaproteobacteria bacterium]